MRMGNQLGKAIKVDQMTESVFVWRFIKKTINSVG